MTTHIISQEQCDAIRHGVIAFGRDKEQFAKTHEIVMKDGGWDAPTMLPLNTLSADALRDCLTNGYDVEQAKPVVDTKETMLFDYYTDWKEKHEHARHNGGRANGFTFEECGRAAQAIEMTLDILGIDIKGINVPHSPAEPKTTT